MPTGQIANFKQGPGSQRGAALMVMLVILVVSVAAILVNSLTATALKNSRKAQTAAALAQAKEALIAYAVSDANRPGELPCPDFNNDGPITLSEDYSGSNCLGQGQVSVGWLPWKSLGLPDLRDGNGDRLWYAVTNPFHANGTSILNSDTPTTLSTQMLTVVDGTVTLASGVIAIVFSPGTPLSGQTRSASDNNATNARMNYLEGDNANLNTTFQTANSTTVNDSLLTISAQDLFPPVERRIAREAKACLDSYAAASAGKYPWAAPVGDATSSPGINGDYTGVYQQYFGRIAVTPITTTRPIDPTASAMLTALSNLQTALNAYSTSVTPTTTSALLSASQTLITAAHNADNSSSFSSYNSITGNADTAGDKGSDLANGSGSSVSTVQGYINSTNSSLSYNGFTDSTMSLTWPATCSILNNPSSYFWTAWKNLVFYQVASGYRPNGGSVALLSINASGAAYRATVLIARAAIGTQLAGRSNPATDPPAPYLEGINPHSGSTPTTTFVSYGLSDPNYAMVNDLVLCLDGGNQCK